MSIQRCFLSGAAVGIAAPFILDSHMHAQAQAEGKTSEDVIQKLLDTVQPPLIGKYDKKRK